MSRRLLIISGCNAAGKSTFIRSRINLFENYVIIMPDVHKSATFDVFEQAIEKCNNIVLENILREDEVFKMIELARNRGYQVSLFQLFIKSPEASIERVTIRALMENSYNIDKDAVDLNFKANFTKLANSYYIFDETHFIHTGIKNENELIMSFELGTLVYYKSNDLPYIQYFSDYVKSIGKDLQEFNRIEINRDYTFHSFTNPDLLSENKLKERKGPKL